MRIKFLSWLFYFLAVINLIPYLIFYVFPYILPSLPLFRALKELSTNSSFTWKEHVLKVSISLLAILVGIGLNRYKKWAWYLALITVLIGAFYLYLSFIFFGFLVIFPAIIFFGMIITLLLEKNHFS